MNTDTVLLLRKKLARSEGWTQIGSLTVHFSERCNLDCRYCSYATQHGQRSIDPAAVERLLDQEPIYSCIVGGGEPILVDSPRGRFASLVAGFHPSSVYMITNGTVLPAGLEGVADRFDFVRLSLDAACPDTYRQLKGVDLFAAVVENIGRYLDAGVSRVGASFVVQKGNIHEVPALVEMLAPIFYAYPHRFFLKFKNLREAPAFLPSPAEIAEATATLRAARAASPLVAAFLDLATNYEEIVWLAENRDSRPPRSVRCYYALLYTLVAANGEVYPCGLMSRKRLHCLGNVLTDSWADICQRQYQFFEADAGAGQPDCAGCWDDDKNLILQTLLESGIQAHPSLTRLGGIGSFYCRW
jgi:radical SAM protein with 4Fe4S-binding SPASM domain